MKNPTTHGRWSNENKTVSACECHFYFIFSNTRLFSDIIWIEPWCQLQINFQSNYLVILKIVSKILLMHKLTNEKKMNSVQSVCACEPLLVANYILFIWCHLAVSSFVRSIGIWRSTIIFRIKWNIIMYSVWIDLSD